MEKNENKKSNYSKTWEKVNGFSEKLAKNGENPEKLKRPRAF